MAAIAEDLAWLGLAWHGEIRKQSEHLPDYRAALAILATRALVYPCFCTRSEIAAEIAASSAAPHAPDGGPLYPGTCRRLDPAHRAARLAAREPHAWRLDMARAVRETGPLTYHESGMVRCRPERFGDVVLARKDAPASYHLCVSHDDALQGVTLVTRGEDLRPATDVHRLLQSLMGWPEPAYAHHPILQGSDGRRLAKRNAALPLRTLRSQGRTPADILSLVRLPDGSATRIGAVAGAATNP